LIIIYRWWIYLWLCCWWIEIRTIFKWTHDLFIFTS